jgi:hypothetical protein
MKIIIMLALTVFGLIGFGCGRKPVDSLITEVGVKTRMDQCWLANPSDDTAKCLVQRSKCPTKMLLIRFSPDSSTA